MTRTSGIDEVLRALREINSARSLEELSDGVSRLSRHHPQYGLDGLWAEFLSAEHIPHLRPESVECSDALWDSVAFGLNEGSVAKLISWVAVDCLNCDITERQATKWGRQAAEELLHMVLAYRPVSFRPPTAHFSVFQTFSQREATDALLAIVTAEMREFLLRRLLMREAETCITDPGQRALFIDAHRRPWIDDHWHVQWGTEAIIGLLDHGMPAPDPLWIRQRLGSDDGDLEILRRLGETRPFHAALPREVSHYIGNPTILEWTRQAEPTNWRATSPTYKRSR